MRVVAQHAGRLAGEIAPRHLAQAQTRQGAPDLFGLQRQSDLGRADIAGLRQDRGQIDHTKIVFVLLDLVADLEESWRGVHDAVRVVLPGGQRSGHDEGFDAGARLENIGRGAVAIQRGLELIPVVGVVRWLVHHRQHFTGIDVDDHDGARVRAVFGHRRLQFPVSQILYPQVDAGGEIAARPRRADAFDIFNVPAVRVLYDTFRTVFAVQQLIEAKLQAFLALIIDGGESHDMPRHLARGGVTTVLAQQGHAGNSQGFDVRRLLRRHVPFQVQEFAVEVAGDAAGQGLLVLLERLAQLRQFIDVFVKFLGGDPSTV